MCVCACVCARACMHACVCVRVRARVCVRACTRVCVCRGHHQGDKKRPSGGNMKSVAADPSPFMFSLFKKQTEKEVCVMNYTYVSICLYILVCICVYAYMCVSRIDRCASRSK